MRVVLHQAKPLSLALLTVAWLIALNASANPTAPTVVSGTASFPQAGTQQQITNSPNTIINWQSFSIGANEVTRFVQQSSASAVLNKVIRQNSTVIGSLSRGTVRTSQTVVLTDSTITSRNVTVRTLSNTGSAVTTSGNITLTGGTITTSGNVTLISTGSTVTTSGNVSLPGGTITTSGNVTSPTASNLTLGNAGGTTTISGNVTPAGTMTTPGNVASLTSNTSPASVTFPDTVSTSTGNPGILGSSTITAANRVTASSSRAPITRSIASGPSTARSTVILDKREPLF
jgi:filamentous hemagglutinin family protein